MAQCLRALLALTTAPSSVLSGSKPSITPVPGDPLPSDLRDTRHTCGPYIHLEKNIQIHKQIFKIILIKKTRA